MKKENKVFYVVIIVLIIIIAMSCTKQKSEDVITYQVEYVIDGDEVNYYLEYADEHGESVDAGLLGPNHSFKVTAVGDAPIWCKISSEGYADYEISIIVDGVVVDYFIGRLNHKEVVFLNY